MVKISFSVNCNILSKFFRDLILLLTTIIYPSKHITTIFMQLVVLVIYSNKTGRILQKFLPPTVQHTMDEKKKLNAIIGQRIIAF